MERPLRPAFRTTFFSSHLRNPIETFVCVPDGIYPMDLYNALLKHEIQIHKEDTTGWMTSKGRYVDTYEAAELAFETNMLDKKVKRLTVEDYPGSWRAKKLNWK